jgi:SAM-dependent methyltransferase
MKLNDLPALPGPPPRNARTDAAWRAVFEAACAPYRPPSGTGPFSLNPHWAWHWARGKLSRDPVFRGMLERGDLRPQACVLDVGCGQGLVAGLLHGCQQLAARGQWPADWPAAPSAAAYTGVELMARDADRGNRALQGLPFKPLIICGDMCSTPFPPCDLVVILDVLHYVDHAAQLGVLQRVREALAPGGRLLLRVGDTANTRGFAASQWVDHLVTWVRGHRVAPTWGRSLDEWTALLRELGFTQVQRVPMSQGTPFANVLLVADLGPGT